MKKTVLLFSIHALCSTFANACTLWGKIGTSVENGGLLIAKNRDAEDDIKTIITRIAPDGGFRYLAMYDDGTRGGINEHGLVVFTATASSVKEENRLKEGKGKNGLILSECRSVQDVLDNQEKYLLGRTQFLLIGDSKELISVEITPDNQIHIERISNGSLHHTNHYLWRDFFGYNEKKVESSSTRCERVGTLLQAEIAMNLADMVRISEDQDAGADDSIWREGSSKGSNRTVMSMRIYVPTDGQPVVSVKSSNKGEKEKQAEFTIGATFWDKVGEVKW